MKNKLRSFFLSILFPREAKDLQTLQKIEPLLEKISVSQLHDKEHEEHQKFLIKQQIINQIKISYNIEKTPLGDCIIGQVLYIKGSI